MDKDYYEKYIKYKSKYIELKHIQDQLKQTGGVGYNITTWDKHPNFYVDNNICKNKLLINNMDKIDNREADSKKTQFDCYSELLTNLLEYNNGIINLDFINNFHRYIYYDHSDDFAINIVLIVDQTDSKKRKKILNCEWVNDKNHKYSICKNPKPIIQDHEGSIILWLEEKNKTYNKKVLKIFNKIPIEKLDTSTIRVAPKKIGNVVSTGTNMLFNLGSSIVSFFSSGTKTPEKSANQTDLVESTPAIIDNKTIKEIKDYLSLQIIEISDNHQRLTLDIFDPRHIRINNLQLDYINFNMQTEFIKNQLDNKMILASQNIIPINDYIINIILQQIDQENEKNKLYNHDIIPPKYVKYHNLFVTKIIINEPDNWVQINNNDYRYCILMDCLDGSVATLLNNEVVRPESEKICMVNDILNSIEKSINVFKNPKYLFTHTDLKLENIFYKNTPDGLEYYLADFDKSSINYHNIRFYPKGLVTVGGLLYNNTNHDKYGEIDSIIRKYDLALNIPHIYKLSRIGNNYQSDIEFEQLYMRYNFTPYYISFDICTLLMSLINNKFLTLKPIYRKNLLLNDYNQQLYTFIRKYIDNESIKFFIEIFDEYIKIENGNFGDLLNIYFGNNDNKVKFINNFNNVDFLYINKLYLTPTSRKIALSLPFKPYYISKSGTSSIYDLTQTTTTRKSERTKDFYKELQIENEMINKFIDDNSITLEYNMDPRTDTEDILICKINRFGKTESTNIRQLILPGFKHPHEVEVCDLDHNQLLIMICCFLDIHNNNNLIPKNINLDILDENIKTLITAEYFNTYKDLINQQIKELPSFTDI